MCWYFNITECVGDESVVFGNTGGKVFLDCGGNDSVVVGNDVAEAVSDVVVDACIKALFEWSV